MQPPSRSVTSVGVVEALPAGPRPAALSEPPTLARRFPVVPGARLYPLVPPLPELSSLKPDHLLSAVAPAYAPDADGGRVGAPGSSSGARELRVRGRMRARRTHNERDAARPRHRPDRDQHEGRAPSGRLLPGRARPRPPLRGWAACVLRVRRRPPHALDSRDRRARSPELDRLLPSTTSGRRGPRSPSVGFRSRTSRTS